MRRPALVLTLALGAAAAAPEAAGAQPTGRVLVVELPPGAPQAWPEGDRHVRAELAQSDLEVVALPLASEDVSDDELALVRRIRDEARRRDALAAVLLLRQGEGGDATVRVWVADEVTGKLVSREMEGNDGAPLAPPDAGLAAVELLHASLVEIRLGRRGRPPRPVPPAAERFVEAQLREAPSEAIDLEIAVGVSVPMMWRGFGPSVGPRVAVGVTTEHWLVGLDAWIGARTTERDQAHGAVRLRSSGILGWAAIRKPMARGLLMLGVGGGVLALWGEGHPSGEWTGTRDAGVAPVIGLRLGGQLRLGEELAVELAVDLLTALPPPEIAGGSNVGAPVLAPSVALVWGSR